MSELWCKVYLLDRQPLRHDATVVYSFAGEEIEKRCALNDSPVHSSSLGVEAWRGSLDILAPQRYTPDWAVIWV